jgi:hypothetical protein
MNAMTETDSKPVGQVINDLAEVRKEIMKKNAEVKDLQKEKSELEAVLMARFKEQGVTRMAADGYTVTLAKQTVPTIKDWTAFSKYVVENDALYLLQRRLSPAPYRDLLDQGQQVPGLEPFEVESIGFTTTG